MSGSWQVARFCYLKIWSVCLGGIKKAEKLSQCFGPTSTYEKQPF